MDQSRVDFWQREAARYETNVHALVTRTYALLGVGFTALASIAIGILTTRQIELVLLVPFVVVFGSILALWTLEEVLVKALYQFRAERILADALDTQDGYLTWEDFGGRIGLRSWTTHVRVGTVIAANLILLAGSLGLFLAKADGSRLGILLTAVPGLVVFAILAGVLLVLLVLGLIVTGCRMLRTYRAARTQLGYVAKLTETEAIATADRRGASSP